MRQFAVRWWITDPQAKYAAAIEELVLSRERKKQKQKEERDAYAHSILSGTIPTIGTFEPIRGDLAVNKDGTVSVWSGQAWHFYSSSEMGAKLACLKLASI